MTEPLYNRMTAKTRRNQILEAGLTLAKHDGLINVKRRELAVYVGISAPSVTHHFGDMDSLRNEVVLLAIERQDLRVVGEAVVLKYPAAEGLSDDAKRAAIDAYVI